MVVLVYWCPVYFGNFIVPCGTPLLNGWAVLGDLGAGSSIGVLQDDLDELDQNLEQPFQDGPRFS